MSNATTPVAIVTAASKGIGEACARELAARGYRLAIMARSVEIETVTSGTGAVAIRGDVIRPDDLKRFVKTATSEHGRLDAVVANTGLSPDRWTCNGQLFDPELDDSITDYDNACWHDMFDMQFLVVVRLARLVTPIMQARM